MSDLVPIPYIPETLTSEDAIVHLEYDPENIPALPSDGTWTRFICISDTHSRTFPVPPGDVLLHSGDLTSTGTVGQFKKTMDWICEMPHKYKIIIAGNHDLPLHTPWYDDNFARWHQKSKQPIKPIQDMLTGPEAKTNGVIYLQDEKFEFQVKDGGRMWSVYGSPWSPEFFNWAFNYSAHEAEGIVSGIPPTDILLTHGPPYKLFDRTRSGEDVGCPTLAKYLPKLQPRLHLFGHIHEAHGARIVDWDETPDLSSIDTAGSDVASDITMHSVEMEDCGEGDDQAQNEGIVSGEETPSHIRDSPPPKLATAEAGRERTTVFANAANWPSGARASREGGIRIPFAGPGFQPVIVDLRD